MTVLTDDAIIEIASNPGTSPINPFSDHPAVAYMTGKEARERTLAFARAIEEAVLSETNQKDSDR